jgi:hypothetical protein
MPDEATQRFFKKLDAIDAAIDAAFERRPTTVSMLELARALGDLRAAIWDAHYDAQYRRQLTDKGYSWGPRSYGPENRFGRG